MTRKVPKKPDRKEEATQGQSGRGLSADEQKLWSRVAETVKRDQRSKSALLLGVDLSAMQRALGESDEREKPKTLAPAKAQTKRTGSTTAPSPTTAQPKLSKTQPIGKTASRSKPTSAASVSRSDLDPKTLRKVRSGRHAIEARLDLHGMRQHEAHGELRAFLHRCHAKGRRWVLVITGKGLSRSSIHAVEQNQSRSSHWSDDFSERSRPGILKERVPTWLAEPDLKMIVIGFSQAAPQHGGEGAIYVQLRSRAKL